MSFVVKRSVALLLFLGTVQKVFLPFQNCRQKNDTCANNVDPDKTARNEQTPQDLHLLSFRFSYFRFLYVIVIICCK